MFVNGLNLTVRINDRRIRRIRGVLALRPRQGLQDHLLNLPRQDAALGGHARPRPRPVRRHAPDRACRNDQCHHSHQPSAFRCLQVIPSAARLSPRERGEGQFPSPSIDLDAGSAAETRTRSESALAAAGFPRSRPLPRTPTCSTARAGERAISSLLPGRAETDTVSGTVL